MQNYYRRRGAHRDILHVTKVSAVFYVLDEVSFRISAFDFRRGSFFGNYVVLLCLRYDLTAAEFFRS